VGVRLQGFRFQPLLPIVTEALCGITLDLDLVKLHRSRASRLDTQLGEMCQPEVKRRSLLAARTGAAQLSRINAVREAGLKEPQA